MRVLQFQDVLDIAGKHQVVATHDKLVLVDGHCDVVEVAHLDEPAALHVEQSGIAQRLADKLISRWHQHLHGIFCRILRVGFRRLAVGQQSAHGDDTQHADGQTEQTGDGRSQYVHRRARVVGIETRDNQVWRRTNQRTHATHARGVAQRNEQLRWRDIQLLRPHFYNSYEERHHRRIAQKRTQRSHRQHQSNHSLGVGLRLPQQVFHNPLQHAGIGQSGHHHKQHANHNDRRATEAREGLFGI